MASAADFCPGLAGVQSGGADARDLRAEAWTIFHTAHRIEWRNGEGPAIAQWQSMCLAPEHIPGLLPVQKVLGKHMGGKCHKALSITSTSGLRAVVLLLFSPFPLSPGCNSSEKGGANLGGVRKCFQVFKNKTKPGLTQFDINLCKSV